MIVALRIVVGLITLGLAVALWRSAASDAEWGPARIRPFQSWSNRHGAVLIGLVGAAIIVTAPF